MEHTVFTDGHVRVIGFRGAVPYKIGLFPAVYLYTLEDKEHFAIGEEFGRDRDWPCRSAKRINALTKKGGITRLMDLMRVDCEVTVLCVTEETEAVLSDVLPNWRASHVPLLVCHEAPHVRPHVPREPSALKRHWIQNRFSLWYPPLLDPRAWALLLLPDEAEELALTTVIALQTVMDDCLLDNANAESIVLADQLGWIAWGLLSTHHHRARRDTMIRIVASRFLQPNQEGVLRIAKRVQRSLHEQDPETVIDLARAYLRNGVTHG